MKTWLITGVSRDLGQALTQAALNRGDTVIGTVRGGAARPDPGTGTGTGKLHLLQLDIADKAAVEAWVAQAFKLGGRVDVIVNNAGYGLLGAIKEATDAEVEHLFEVNVFGPFRLIRAALPRLRAQGAATSSTSPPSPDGRRWPVPAPTPPPRRRWKACRKACRRRWRRSASR